MNNNLALKLIKQINYELAAKIDIAEMHKNYFIPLNVQNNVFFVAISINSNKNNITEYLKNIFDNKVEFIHLGKEDYESLSEMFFEKITPSTNTVNDDILTIDDELDLELDINDGDEKEIKVSIKVLAKDRRTVKTVSEFSHIAKKDSSDTVFESENLLGEDEVLVCEIEGDYVKDRAFYRHGALALRPTEAELEIDEVCRTVTVRAGAEYIHSAMLSGNAIFDDNCFSLLPGESRTVAYRPLKTGSPECIEAEAYTLV